MNKRMAGSGSPWALEDSGKEFGSDLRQSNKCMHFHCGAGRARACVACVRARACVRGGIDCGRLKTRKYRRGGRSCSVVFQPAEVARREEDGGMLAVS